MNFVSGISSRIWATLPRALCRFLCRRVRPEVVTFFIFTFFVIWLATVGHIRVLRSRPVPRTRAAIRSVGESEPGIQTNCQIVFNCQRVAGKYICKVWHIHVA